MFKNEMSDRSISKELNAGDATCTVEKVRIAVAIACIKSKPEGISARKHAENLCAKFKLNQLKWREKCEVAHTEILHLQQQLVLQSHGHVAEDVRMPEDEDASCLSQNLFPTPPASGSLKHAESVPPTDKTSISVSKHTSFLSHMISLKKMTSCTVDLTKASILSTLQLLSGCIGKDKISWRVQTECVECIVLLIDGADMPFRHVLAEKICDLAKSIAEEIISTYADPFTVQEQRAQLLGKLGSSTSTLQPVIDTLLLYVSNFSEDLRKSVNSNHDIDPDYFCSMYYLINGLEQCICQSKFSELNTEFRQSVNCKMEDCLLHVTEKFPIFAHAIWKICGKILR